MAGFSGPIDKRVRDKVMELVKDGVHKRRSVQVYLESYVRDELFYGTKAPEKNSRR